MKFFKLVSAIPLFLVIFALYNAMVFIGVNFEECTKPPTDSVSVESCQVEPLFTATLPSGKTWGPTWGSLLLLFAMFALYIELIKSTRTASITQIEHVLSMTVFIAYLMEFILVKGAGTSTFLILTLMSSLDVIAGFMITVASARRDITMGR